MEISVDIYSLKANDYAYDMDQQKSFHILSIDGGGVRGIIPARILQSLEESSGKPICDLFDLIVGTSTGGLIALGLTCPGTNNRPKFRAQDIVNVYLNQSDQIFNRSIWHALRSGGGLWGAKYPRQSYDRILEELFSGALLSQALKPVVATAYSLKEGAPSLFTSRQAKAGADFYMRDIAGATSAAPTYFPPKMFSDTKGKDYIEVDGGLFANNPESIGAMESYQLVPGLQRENIRIVSIGTGSPKLTEPAEKLTDAGVIGWIMKANLIDIMMDADSDWYSDEVASLYHSVLRVQVPISDELSAMDNAESSNLQALQSTAESYVKQNPAVLKQIQKLTRQEINKPPISRSQADLS